MSHLIEVIQRVKYAVEKQEIRGMNELLCELSDDAELTQEDRYEQQMILRRAVVAKGRDAAKRREYESDQRRQAMTRAGRIL